MPLIEFRGKEFVRHHHHSVPYRPIEPDATKSVGEARLDGNLIIHGDNLHALKALLPQYAGRVNCIYIDPPYNTGNEKWTYNDNVNSPVMQSWLKDNPVTDDDLLRHDKWACMMWPRLVLLHELLAEDGVIFISIDDNEQHRLRVMMDEIFGEMLAANLIWHHRKSSQNDIDVSLSHNHIVVYAKNRELFSFSNMGIDESNFSNPDNDKRGPWTADPMDAPNVRENLTYPIINPNTQEEYWPPEGRHWRFSKEKFEEALKNKRIIFGKNGKARPQYKRFMSEAQTKGTNIFTIWSDVGTATNGTQELNAIFGEKRVFDTPKPTTLLKKIIKVSTKTDAIVLDSFAGSGTTAHAVLQQNAEDGGDRKFILVECEDYADTITAERVRRVIKGVAGAKNANLANGLGGEFTYCTLGDTIEMDKLLTGDQLPTFEQLGALLFHSATEETIDIAKVDEKTGYLGTAADRHIWLIYKPDMKFITSDTSALTLDKAKAFAKQKTDDKRHLVFAPVTFVPYKRLQAEGIPVDYQPLPWSLYRVAGS